METPNLLRVLFVEDLPSDVILAEQEIRKSGLEFSSQRVDTKDAFLKALGEFRPDIVVSDYSMPKFDGMQALKLSRERDSRIPFIILTGSMNEETTVACMKAGASDYVIKERIARLPFAVSDALEEKAVRAAKEQTERLLRESEARYRSVLESATDAIVTADSNGLISGWNKGAERIFGYRYTEIVGESLTRLMPSIHHSAHIEGFHRQKSGGMPVMMGKTTELDGVRKDGSIFSMELSLSAWESSGGEYYTGIIRDVSDRKRTEEALVNSEKKFKWLFDHAPVAYHVLSPEADITDVNLRWCETLGYSRDEVLGKPIFDFILGSELPFARAMFEAKKKNISAIRTRNERTYVAKDGTSRTFLMGDVVTVDSQDEVTSIQTTMEDISERKKAEYALRLSEERFRSVWDNSADGMRLTDREGRIITVNDAFCRLVRRSREELLGNIFSVAYQNQGPDDELSVYQKRFEGRETISNFFASAKLWNGETIDLNISSSFIETTGQERLLLSLFRDVTEQKRGEKRLEEERTLLRTIIDAIPDEIVVKDTERRFILVNPGAVRALRRSSAEEIIGKRDEDLVPEKFALMAREEEESVLKCGLPSLSGVGNSDINPLTDEIDRTILISKIPLKDNSGKVVGLVVINRDITEVQRANAALEKERSLLITLIENIPDEICLKDLSHRFIVVNSGIVRAIGAQSIQDMVGKTDFDFMRPDLAQIHFDEEDAILESGKPIINLEAMILNPKTGALEKCKLTTKALVRDSSGKKIGILVVNRNVTEQKRAEQALRASEQKFRVLFEESKDVVYVSTVDGKLLDINPAGVELFGYGSKEGFSQIDLAAGYEDPGVKERFDAQMEQQGFVKDFEVTFKRADGKKIQALETATAVRDKEGKVVQYRGMIRDVTSQRLLESQFIQAQKMESIGTLAGGIAHDFNNILGIILGNLALLEGTRENKVQFDESVVSMSKAVERGASLVRQILTFARKNETAIEPVNINSAIKELAKMLEGTFPKTIEIRQKFDRTVPIVLVDPTQLHQAILNLCVNARDAMNGKGSLSLTTHLVTGRDVLPKFPNATALHYVQVSVKDTGTGIDGEIRKHLFEPFFTTKEKGKGTGLGLAVVYGVLQAHRGFIDVESAPGSGTTFHLFFPAPEGIITTSEKQRGSQADPPRGTETILVVEDEEVLRDLLTNLLEMQGYKVIPASDGEEAFIRFSEHAEEIGLVLSDMGLPKRSGWDAYRMMQKLNPKARILLASGYIEAALKAEILKSDGVRFIQKPYEMEEVGRAVREMLDSRREPPWKNL